MAVYELQTDKENNSVILRCECSYPEHQLEFSWMKDINGDVDFLYAGVTLSKQRFFRRVWFAIKYLFCQPSRFGAFEESVFEAEDAKKLITFLNGYLEAVENNK